MIRRSDTDEASGGLSLLSHAVFFLFALFLFFKPSPSAGGNARPPFFPAKARRRQVRRIAVSRLALNVFGADMGAYRDKIGALMTSLFLPTGRCGTRPRSTTLCKTKLRFPMAFFLFFLFFFAGKKQNVKTNKKKTPHLSIMCARAVMKWHRSPHPQGTYVEKE